LPKGRNPSPLLIGGKGRFSTNVYSKYNILTKGTVEGNRHCKRFAGQEGAVARQRLRLAGIMSGEPKSNRMPGFSSLFYAVCFKQLKAFWKNGQVQPVGF